MTPQERQLVDDLFDRLSKVENAPRDPDASGAIAQGLRIAPNAVYPLVQTVLLQDEALRRANDRIHELEAQGAPQQDRGGGFLDSMRGALFGQGQPQQGQSQGSVPNVRPSEAPGRPVWNSGQVLQQSGQYDQGGYDRGGYGQGGYGQPYGGAQAPGCGMMGGGGGSSFLGTAAAAAAGVVGGSLLLNSIRGMMGGGHQAAFGDTSRAGSSSPWTDQSNSSLARDAGINDIGSKNDLAAQDRAQDLEQDREDDLRAADERDDLEAEANDDFGGDNDSDFA